MSMTDARKHFDALVRRAASTRDRVTVTDHAEPVAVIVNAQELADLEDALALARYDARQARGESESIPHAEVRARLGPPRR